MDSHAYQLLALGARYLFVFWIAVIVLRASLSLLKEHGQRKKMLRNLPDAGMVGEMCDMDNGKSYPLPREGVLGSGRGCDIRIRGLRRRHVNFAFVDGKGLLLTPCHHRSTVLLDGQPIRRGGYALHGACLQAGEYQLRIRLFAGLKMPRRAQFAQAFEPAYEEDLYAPDELLFTPVQPDFVPYPTEEMHSMQETPVAYAQPDLYPQQEAYPQPEFCAPNDMYYASAVQTPAEDGDEPPLPFNNVFAAAEEDPLPGARVRRRRSERNKHL